MQSYTTLRVPRLFGLVDAAARPAEIHALLEKSGAEFQSVFAGLPEDALGPASLFLVPITDTEADWVVELDRIDLHSPCLSLVWSRVEMDPMIRHLQAFLFADIGDGMTALVRFFDPRNTGAVMRVWGDQIRNVFMGPIERWMYRGRHQDWQRIENDSLSGARISGSIMVHLEQPDIDALTAHTEPDELLATLIESGLADGEPSYLDRFANFAPRYQRAGEWGFTEASDRLTYCRHSYLDGADFDQHQWVRHALIACRTTGEPLSQALGTMPQYVRDELERKRDAQTGMPPQ